ncbi:hypothetical protein ACLB2K_067257 [Fragaria x ananassa]
MRLWWSRGGLEGSGGGAAEGKRDSQIGEWRARGGGEQQKSFRDLDKKDYDDEGYKPSLSSTVKRARRKANKQSKS